MSVLDFIPGMVGTLDFIFSPLNVFPTYISLMVISIFLTLIVMAINKFAVNKKIVKGVKERIEQLRENLTQAQKSGDTENANKLLQEMMKANSEIMKHSFKALIISMVVLFLFLPWIQTRYEGMAVANLPLDVPFIGNKASWIVWYFLISLSVGWVMRKLFEVDYV